MDGTRLIRQDAALVARMFGAAAGLVAALFVSLALVGALGGVSLKDLIPGLRLGEPRVEALAPEPIEVPAAIHVVAAPAPVAARPVAAPPSKPAPAPSRAPAPDPATTQAAVPAAEPSQSPIASAVPVVGSVVDTAGGVVGGVVSMAGGLLGGLLGR
jgi:hypothetical protein